MQTSIHIEPSGQKEVKIIVETTERGELISVITGALAASGGAILRGQIEACGAASRAVFEINPPDGMDWERFKGDILRDFEKLSSGHSEEVYAGIRTGLIRYLGSQKGAESEQLYPIYLQIDQESLPSETVVDIRLQDSPAFLYELSQVFTLMEINIVGMEFDTVCGKVNNRLWLNCDGQKITSENKLKAVQWTILFVKYFTYLLSKVADPGAAIEQFAMLGRDIFELSSFKEILSAFQKSKSLKNLGKALGENRFLWEELIRSQYEVLVPIFGSEEIFKKKKRKEEMAQELKETLERKKTCEEKADALNEFKDREMLRIDLRLMLGRISYLGDFAEEFTDLVEVVVGAGYALAFEQAALRYPMPVIDGHTAGESAIFALGKFGGRELGYASALEILLVYTDAADSSSPPDHQNQEFFDELLRIFRGIISAKFKGVFEINLCLSPHGQDGPLAVSLEAFRKYYSPSSVGGTRNFERQALIKLRPVAGSRSLGETVMGIRDRFVYSDEPFDFGEVFKLRIKQQKEHTGGGVINAKYGTGGLLDAEYLVQTLQITYGRKLGGDVRHPNTLKAMSGLWQAEVLSEKQFQDLRSGYVFLRNLINVLRLVRGHARDLTVPPEDVEEFLVLGRRLGFTGDDYKVKAQFKLVLRHYTEIVSSSFENWMERLSKQDWLVTSHGITAGSESAHVSLDELLRGELSVKSGRLLEASGFTDISGMAAGLKRLSLNTPAFEYFAKAIDRSWPLWKTVGDPDRAIKYLEGYADSLTDKGLFWKMLSESEKWLEVLLKILGSSRYLSELLIANPNDYFWIQHAENYSLGSLCRVVQELAPQTITIEALRKFRHQEVLRAVLAEMMTSHPLRDIFEAYSTLADFVIEKIARQCFRGEPFCVIGLGKLGGKELNFSSDVDLMFVIPGTTKPVDFDAAIRNFVNVLKDGGPLEFLYRVDLQLRPHGDKGSLFLAPEGYRRYYAEEAEAWEYQALMRARSVAGHKALGEAILSEVAPRIWRMPWNDKSIGELREVKRKCDAQVVRDQETETNIKMGFGGIRDIEFTVQMVQLLHGGRSPALRTGNTFDGLTEIRKQGLLSEEDCAALDDGYQFLRRVENRLQLYENRQVFKLPESNSGLRCLARGLGFYGSGDRMAEDEFRQVLYGKMRVCRRIFERIYYGQEAKS